VSPFLPNIGKSSNLTMNTGETIGKFAGLMIE
jgi:hypothetical protein